MATHPSPQATPLTGTTPEAELIARAAAGEAQAFEVIMRCRNRLLFRTARSILQNDDEAEDVLRDAYLRAWQALARFRAEAKLSTWLVRIVANEALARLRRKGADIIPLELAMAAIDPKIEAAFVDEAAATPEHQTLRAVEEMEMPEVALALGIPEATVRTRFFRARSLLREGLASAIYITLSDTLSFDGARCDHIVASVLAKARTMATPGKA